MSYAQVVKSKCVNKSVILHNNSKNVFCHSCVDKHACKPCVDKYDAQKSTGVISKTPEVIQKHDHPEKVFNGVKTSIRLRPP